VKGFDAWTCCDVILNTLSWSRREVVALPDKKAGPTSAYQQVDAAGNCLGICYLPCFVLVDVGVVVGWGGCDSVNVFLVGTKCRIKGSIKAFLGIVERATKDTGRKDNKYHLHLLSFSF